MKHHNALILLIVLVVGCTPEPAIVPTASPVPTLTSSPVPPTVTISPSPIPPTETLIPSPTPLPGKLVLPLDTLGSSIPWLPVDETARPVVNYVAFNVLRPPFNSALVRQAFAHAIDRQVIVEMAEKYKTRDPKAATTFTPPVTLGRDLYNEVGAQFDPQRAKELLTEAGYSDPSAFPAVTLIVNSYGDVAPGARFNMANTMADMWQEYLGVSVQVQAFNRNDFNNRVQNNLPEMYWLGWVADYNDPDNFLNGVFHSGGEYNFGNFSSAEFDRLVEQAANLNDPAERQTLYIQAEHVLCEIEAGLIPLYHSAFP
jgi:oligopeptide transport system substrate-binding protein